MSLCFRAFEDDGSECAVTESCLVEVCQNFATPSPGGSITYTLSIPNNGINASWGSVNFTISATGSFDGQGNDLICNAIDLGTLNSNTSIGNNTLSNYNNFCATNAGDPNPWGGNNQQGVWFQFTTGAFPASLITIDAKSDPQVFGDGLDLQLALYESSNGSCSGALTLIDEGYSGAETFLDEDLDVNCLKPNTTYFLLVDGVNTGIFGGLEGFFGLEIYDNGIQQAADLICDAEFLGQVPNSGSVATPLLSRSNSCASNLGDPVTTNFSNEQGVWFQFQAPTSGNVNIVLNSDVTDAIDLQFTIYGTANGLGNCGDVLEEISSIYSPAMNNESLAISCLVPNAYYWVLVDGSATNMSGVFDILISDSNLKDINTWNGTFWTRGTPTKYQHVVVDAPYNVNLLNSIEACDLTVNSGSSIQIESSGYVNIQNDLTVDGALSILSNGSLVQVKDSGINTGNISYSREVQVRLLDYVYWSSPINGYNINSLSPLTPVTNIFKWNPIILNNNGGSGNWVAASGEIMLSGSGYIVRAPSGYNETTPQSFIANFENGIPNNGVITVPISRGNNNGSDYLGTNGTTITRYDDNWNLVGNPYPSAINSLDFLNLNTNIEGAIRLWTHSSLPTTGINTPFYNNFLINYSPADYITYNGLGTVSGPTGFNGKIATGQGFLVNMLDGVPTTENIIFNNSLRSKLYNNSQFYRSNNSTIEMPIDRIWLDIVNESSFSDRTLIGYIEGATNEKDRLFDAVTGVSNNLKIYSLLDNERMTIQGKQWPFFINDEVGLGYFTPSQGIYKIAIAAVDGVFEGQQDIFIEDKELNIVHDLKATPYVFNTNRGEFKNRFVLKFNNSSLETDDFEASQNEVIVSSASTILIQSDNYNLSKVYVYNLLGQIIYENSSVDDKELIISEIAHDNSIKIIKVITENNRILFKKIIY